MSKRVAFLRNSIAELDVAAYHAKYHNDVLASLRLYYSKDNPGFDRRFLGSSQDEVNKERLEREEETDLRSCFAVLSALEAAFRIDYLQRRQGKRGKKNEVSRAFRQSPQGRHGRVRLDDILEVWQVVYPNWKCVASELRSAFKFRHWLAHGRYWKPKLGRRYDFQYLYPLAVEVLEEWPLCGRND
jgi:hypothetical protein